MLFMLNNYWALRVFRIPSKAYTSACQFASYSYKCVRIFAGKFQTELGKAWAAEIVSRRKK